MVFSSNAFLLFAPVVLLLFYASTAVRYQNFVLICASLAFLAYTGLVNLYVAAVAIAIALLYFAFIEHRQRVSMAAVAVTITALLVNLCYFKYRDFLQDVTGLQLPVPESLIWLVPLGISFYTFQIISSIYDRRQQLVRPAAHHYAIYVLFFPQLIAGPIVRFRTLFEQFDYPKRICRRNLIIGAHLFVLGYAKKTVIADPIARLIDPVWSNPAEASAAMLWVAAVGFYVQVYADFSGYTDMGRGVARMLGFRLPINFRAPYFAATPAEFWSRWHMTLSGFIKYYVYNPLAARAARVFRNPHSRRVSVLAIMIVTMTLIGIWHGGAWRFVVFGVTQGILLAAWYGATNGRNFKRRGTFLAGILVTQILLVLSFIVFRAQTPGDAAVMLMGMFDPGGAFDLPWQAAVCGFGLLAILSVQLVDYHATARPVAAVLCRLRQSTGWLPVLLVVFGLAFAAQTFFESYYFGAGGPSQPRFIYFDF